jgi:Predicted acyltransferase
MKIKEIPSKQTLPLRSEILRPGKNISTCMFEGDDAPDTRHFGAMDEQENIVGVVSVYRKGHPAIQQESAWQIRAMATSAAYRGQGIGLSLLVSAENYARESGGLVIWANARSSAIGFYAKAGYSVISEEFMIDGVGPHYLVMKPLDSQGK